MVGSESGAQAGRSTRRSQGTTPVRNVSPPRRATRAGSAAPGSTPGTRRSTRAASRRIDEVNDAVTNTALPEIQTRQSYAYGSSKAPVLPEQLHAHQTMSMGQLTARMDSAIQQAEKNLNDHLAEVNDRQAESNALKRQQRAQIDLEEQKRRDEDERRARLQNEAEKRASPMSHTTEKQKQVRTAAWASSLDSDQLDDIPEETSNEPESPGRTEPSSFPSGIFDHSYNYERGVRAPKREHTPVILPFLRRCYDFISVASSRVYKFSVRIREGVTNWLQRFMGTAWRAFFEFPESPLVATLVKSFLVICLTLVMSWVLCFANRNYFCDPSSTSSISQTLQSLCGTCVNTNYDVGLNLTGADRREMAKLTNALKSINNKIGAVESQLAQRIDSNHATVQSEIGDLRQQHSDLTGLLENLAPNQAPEPDVLSPLMSKVNFFLPAMGATINAEYTSPTQSTPRYLPIRILSSLVGWTKFSHNGPLTALLPWQDVGDCWCAAASTAPNQDKVRIGIEVRELIYPTELVIEHAPSGTTITPDTAPRNIELWADFSHLTPRQWKELDIESMQTDNVNNNNDDDDNYNKVTNTRSKGQPFHLYPHQSTEFQFARLATFEYDASGRTHHIQRFRLPVNQQPDNLKYSAKMFIVRATTNHGADYTCLYRLRLHGVPVEENPRETKFISDWLGSGG